MPLLMGARKMPKRAIGFHILANELCAPSWKGKFGGGLLELGLWEKHAQPELVWFGGFLRNSTGNVIPQIGASLPLVREFSAALTARATTASAILPMLSSPTNCSAKLVRSSQIYAGCSVTAYARQPPDPANQVQTQSKSGRILDD